MTQGPKRLLIVDDEELARERLIKLINAYATKNTLSIDLHEACDGVEAIEKINALNPEIVLLDIQMPEVSGFDVLSMFPNREFRVIFQTAFSEHAVQAFQVAAIDYLLKPFSAERLQQALDRVFQSTTEKATIEPSQEKVDRELALQKLYIEHVPVKVGSRIKIIDVAEIQYFLSEEHITQLFTADADFACDPSLSALEIRLDPSVFVRIHRNAIVNLRQIRSYTLEANAKVTLKSGATLRVSRERKKELKARMAD